MRFKDDFVRRPLSLGQTLGLRSKRARTVSMFSTVRADLFLPEFSLSRFKLVA